MVLVPQALPAVVELRVLTALAIALNEVSLRIVNGIMTEPEPEPEQKKLGTDCIRQAKD